MMKPKHGAIEKLKSVKLMIELPATLYRDLVAYAEVLARNGARGARDERARLIAPSRRRLEPPRRRPG